jgi:hypothetical protein
MKQSGTAQHQRKTALGMMAALVVGCTACLIPMVLAGGAVGSVAGLLGGWLGWIAGGGVLLAGMSVLVYLRLKPRPAQSASGQTDQSCADAECGC